MSSQKKQIGQKIVLGVLLLCIIALTGFSYLNYIETEEKVSFLENAKGMIMDDLEEIESDLDGLAKENDAYANEIQTSRRRIALLMDSIKRMEVDYQILGRYRKELATIRMENRRLHAVLDSVRFQNALLNQEIDSTRLRYSELERYSEALEIANEDLTQFTDSLINENIQLTAKVKGSKALTITALKGSAYKVRSNGKAVKTTRLSSAERLRACFNIAPNTLLQPGEKVFFLQFVDPENEILGPAAKGSEGGDQVFYSKKVVIDYENRPMNICDFIVVDGLQNPGNYRVNVFYEESLLATSVFTLK
ncbi:hypothetical protein E7Z59_04110 [Robertkochia marina]|uniref:Chromosome partitioning protein ParA n=1 Tax=Robertkochia marina TaxID=1227945 RepID=A0A4S3M5B0_9FLAO|nr:hypothetical protein [Robertkochia marina]THD69521.1 hypothetical protein E7Z59_04110 [Robertkochia marina]TRZ47220.1 hypothetical protein D3A96_00460 [Robertkochia marina]